MATFVLIADKIQKVPSAARVLDQSQRVLQDRGPVQQPRLPEGRPTAARVADHQLHVVAAFFFYAVHNHLSWQICVPCQHSFEVPAHAAPAEGERRRFERARLEGDGASGGLPGTDGRQRRASPLHPWRRHNQRTLHRQVQRGRERAVSAIWRSSHKKLELKTALCHCRINKDVGFTAILGGPHIKQRVKHFVSFILVNSYASICAFSDLIYGGYYIYMKENRQFRWQLSQYLNSKLRYKTPALRKQNSQKKKKKRWFFSHTHFISAACGWKADCRSEQNIKLVFNFLPSWMMVLDRWLHIFLQCVWPCVLDVVLSCAEDLPLAVLLLFCSEGDNIPDAFALVDHLNDWLHLLDDPVSDTLEQTASLRFRAASLSCIFSPVRKMNLHFLTWFLSDSLFRARSPTNGRSHPPGVFCLGMASLQRCSDPRTFSFLSIFSPWLTPGELSQN